MGRRKLFSHDDVLNRTIPVFWKHGLAETTVQDLEKASVVARQCIGYWVELRFVQSLFPWARIVVRDRAVLKLKIFFIDKHPAAPRLVATEQNYVVVLDLLEVEKP